LCRILRFVDDEGRRDELARLVIVDDLAGDILRFEHHRVIDFVLFSEGGDGFLSLRVERDADDFEAVGLVLGVGVDEVGDLGAAGRAPGRPEVQKEHFAFVVGERQDLAGQVGDPKIGGVSHVFLCHLLLPAAAGKTEGSAQHEGKG
jgi:hypothetical protein